MTKRCPSTRFIESPPGDCTFLIETQELRGYVQVTIHTYHCHLLWRSTYRSELQYAAMRMVAGSCRPRHSMRLTCRPSAALRLLGSLRISHNKFLQANKWILIRITTEDNSTTLRTSHFPRNKIHSLFEDIVAHCHTTTP